MTNENKSELTLLLVDDEHEFRQATATALQRRGFKVSQAESGERALALIRATRFDIVVLDLRMEGMDGIETLQQIRQEQHDLPVVILTGHGGFDDAWTGIQLDIVDFLQKPVEIDRLAATIRRRLAGGTRSTLRESTIGELMVPVTSYGRVYDDQPVREAMALLGRPPSEGSTGSTAGRRSVLVFDRRERFVGCLRITDLLQLVVPPFLRDSPYASFFTGMFLAQCKVVGNEPVGALLEERHAVDIEAPLLQAVHLIVSHRLINLPVFRDGELVGVLRDMDLLHEIAAMIASGGQHPDH